RNSFLIMALLRGRPSTECWHTNCHSGRAHGGRVTTRLKQGTETTRVARAARAQIDRGPCPPQRASEWRTNDDDRTFPRGQAVAAVIVAERVTHAYKGGTVALDDVSLEIGTGLFGLLGSNGAGKSTLMRILCTLLVPTQGRVTIDGLDVVADRRSVRRLLGYLPQEWS